MESARVIVVVKANADWENVFASHLSKVKIVPSLLITNALAVLRKQNAVEKVYACTTNVSVCQATLVKIARRKLNAQKIVQVMVYAKMAGVIVARLFVDLIAMQPILAQMDVLKGAYA